MCKVIQRHYFSSFVAAGAEDAGHLLSPATHGVARSLSEIVQQLFLDDQLSRDCAEALSMQLHSSISLNPQQAQGTIPASSPCIITVKQGNVRNWQAQCSHFDNPLCDLLAALYVCL